MPPEADGLVVEAQERIGEFSRARRENPIPGFVPCDFYAVRAALQTIADENLAAGPVFCEWGAGFGVATCLASMIGFEAVGIEIEEDLVDQARALARDFEVSVEFASGSFIPREGDEISDVLAESDWLVLGGRDGHDDLDLDTQEIDLVFAFPWPGEEKVIMSLFDRFGGVGALLLLYLGVEGMKLYRKTA
ncbi:MAG: class I SAM-dependent methyltransferase [Planctomycetota bacterium]